MFLSGLSLRRALGLGGADPGPAPTPLAAVLGPDAHHQGDLSFEGRGEREPAASNETPEGRAQNRRVEIFVTEND